MNIPLSDDKHRFVRDSSTKAHWKSETKFSLKQNTRIFFSDKIIFMIKNILGFCLGLHTAVVFRVQSF